MPVTTPDTPPMALSVSRLRLTDFRCYAAARLDLDERPVVLTGPNGAGKTNMLEAVSLLAPGRGLRGARLDDLARTGGNGGNGENHNPGGWAVAASIATPDGVREIGTGRSPDGGTRRVVRIDGTPAKSQAGLGEHVSAVWLTPQMDRLFTDGSTGRRRFLDRLVFGFDAAHAGRVSGYEHAMRERSRLLRDGAGDDTWLGSLERKMAERGVAIAAARREMTARLARLCGTPSGPFPGAEVTVTGSVEEWLDEAPALTVEDRLQATLRESRPHDANAGGAAFGPHRSDLKVRHLAKDMPAELCSTGEQKALLIAVVLANARLQTAERGRAPLLLLDEVAAHLDEDRREALFEEILSTGAQAWLTGTDPALFAPLGDRAQKVAVEDATLTQGSAV